MSLTLSKWQQEAYTEFFDKEGLALNVDTGLGKSILAVEIAKTVHYNKDTCIIVTPPHLIGDLVEKFTEFYKHIIGIINILNKNNKDIKTGKINIISYQKFIRYEKEILKSLSKKEKYYIIYDEAHMIKNPNSKGFKLAKKLTEKFDISNLCTTATMLSTSNIDLFTSTFLTNKELREEYEGWYDFRTRDNNVKHEKIYTAARQIQVPKSINEHAMKKWINPNIKVIKNSLLVKADYVQIYAPKAKQIDTQLSKMESIKNYDIIIKQLNAKEIERLKNTIKDPSGKALQLANNFYYDEIKGEANFFKYKEKLELLNSVIKTESEKNHKGILFYFYKSELNKLKEHFSKNKRIYYHNPKKDLVEQIKEFEEGNYDLFILNIASASTGVRFKQSSYIIHFTITWNTLSIKQANGRLNYVGREKPYTIYNFVAGNEQLRYIGKRIKETINKAEKWKTEQGEVI